MVVKQVQQTKVRSEKEAEAGEKHGSSGSNFSKNQQEKKGNFREMKAQTIQKQQEKAKFHIKTPAKSEKTTTQSFIVKGKKLIPRGIRLVGLVVSDKMDQTVVVKTQTVKFNQKYRLQDLRTHKLKAHNPKEINAKEGDTVEIQECRKISKYKAFIVTKILVYCGQK